MARAPARPTARDESLPTEFAVFPLPGAVLLPHGRLPLNIFEPRYLRMVDDALASGRVIGMIQPDESRPDTPGGPAMYRVGCLGRLASFSETDDGRYLVTLAGLTRFWVQVELEMARGYRRVRADLARFQDDLATAKPVAIDRDRLLTALRGYFGVRGFDANWEAIEDMPDPDLVRTLAMICPFEPPEKQALLEAPATIRPGHGAHHAARDGRPRHRVRARHAARHVTAQDNPIDPRLLEVLVCPVTRGPLRWDPVRQELVSTQAGLAYPVRDGIPIMLPEEARPLE